MTTEQRRKEDFVLVQQTLDGNEAAVARLAKRMSCIPGFLGGIHRRARRPLAPDLLDEIGQEAAMRVWRDRESFNGTSRLETWVYRYVAHVYREVIKREAKTGYKRTDHEEIQQLHGEAKDLAQAVDDRDELDRIQAALADLPPAHADLIERKLFFGSTFSQIAIESGESPNTIKARYYRALDAVRSSLSSSQGSRNTAQAPDRSSPLL